MNEELKGKSSILRGYCQFVDLVKQSKTGGDSMIKCLLRKIRLHFESKRNWKMKMDVPLTIVARNGKPIAEMKAVSTKPISNRIGIAKKKFMFRTISRKRMMK